jgi:hypothetical protein
MKGSFVLDTVTPTLTLVAPTDRCFISTFHQPRLARVCDQGTTKGRRISNQYYHQKSHIMDNPQRYSHRSALPLRWINILVFIPGLILLLVSILTGATVLFITMAVLLTLSALLGLVAVAGKDRSMPWMLYADLCMAIGIISVLIPVYVRSVVIHACRPIRLCLMR